jgi:DnaK suppressor protein
MTSGTLKLDAPFIEAKRRELMSLRETLRRSAGSTEREEDTVKDAASRQSREYEDDAQELDTLETEGILVNRTVEKLARVDRALAKINAGTYGLSDVSGEPIPEERLNALPEAVNTIREQEESEQKS